MLAERAAVFVDGRYQLQVRDQVDTALFAVEHLVENPPDKWLEANLTAGMRLGYDPWLHTADGAERLAKATAAAGATLIPAESNPLDAVWTDRPTLPLGPVVMHELKFAGETAAEKLARLQAEIAKGKDPKLVALANKLAVSFRDPAATRRITLVMTRAAGRPWALICEDLRQSGSPDR